MKKKLLIAALILILIVAGAVYAIRNNSAEPNLDGTPDSGITEEDDTPGIQAGPTEVVETGVIICLKHADTSGPQTLECALGLESEDGLMYALRSDDPSLLGSYSTEQKVDITGILNPSPDKKYQTDGTITVQTIEPAQAE